jgi:hypothetical protein
MAEDKGAVRVRVSNPQPETPSASIARILRELGPDAGSAR